jgi:hypothetical protein
MLIAAVKHNLALPKIDYSFIAEAKLGRHENGDEIDIVKK